MKPYIPVYIPCGPNFFQCWTPLKMNSARQFFQHLGPEVFFSEIIGFLKWLKHANTLF